MRKKLSPKLFVRLPRLPEVQKECIICEEPIIRAPYFVSIDYVEPWCLGCYLRVQERISGPFIIESEVKNA